MTGLPLSINEILAGGIQGQAALDDLLNGLQPTLTAGSGMSVTAAGEVSINLASNRGLEFTSGALALKQGAAVADASASTVSVTSPDAATQTASYVQADVQTIATRANDLGTQVTQLASDLNSLIITVNALKASLESVEHIAS